jgi:protein phosphatase
LKFGQSTHSGRLRTSNEDRMGFFAPQSRGQARALGWMFVVADGVRGAGFGDLAADTAVRVMQQEFSAIASSRSLVAALPDLVRLANSAVHDETLVNERRGKRMATTLIACALRADEAVVTHVGDSRLYQIRQGKPVFVTDDHTLVNEQRKSGLITNAEQIQSEMRHVLSRSLGPHSYVDVDTTVLPLRAGDVLVLCTDGIHKAMYDDEIAHLAAANQDAQAAADRMVRHAVEVDGSDNATVQVIRAESIETVGMYRGRPYHVART